MSFSKSNSIKEIIRVKKGKKQTWPFLEARVAAGFPSSAENYIENSLDLNELLITHPSATFFVRVKGDSMVGAGIYCGDIAVVDRSLTVSHNKVIIARLYDELTIKRFCIENDTYFLKPENDAYELMEITPEMDFEVWGVVTYVIHSL